MIIVAIILQLIIFSPQEVNFGNSFNEEQPLKASLPISVTEGGINEEHPMKQPNPIDFTEGGIQICFNDVHPLKAFFSILFTYDGIII